MRNLFLILLIAVFGYVAALFLPWYAPAVVALVLAMIFPADSNFLSGFVAGALVWGIRLAVVNNDSATDLPARVAGIIPVGSAWALMALTIALIGLTCGFAALSGSLLRKPRREW